MALVIPAWPCLWTSPWRLEADLLQIGNAQHKANGVKNVELAGTIQAGDGIEVGIEARDDRASGVGFEALQADLLYLHYWDEIETLRGRAEEWWFWRWKPCSSREGVGILEGF